MPTSSLVSIRISPRASLDAVLAFAWQTGVFTSGDALPSTGLTRSTAIDAIEELIRLGLLIELPNAREVGEYRKGRPARRFELDAGAAVVIGMDAGRGHLTTTLADLRGEPLVRRTRDLDVLRDSAGPRQEAVTESVAAVLDEAGRDSADLLAICVGVPAPVDARGESPASHRNDFWQRMNPDFAQLLAEWAPIVRIENDASLAAVAEGARGAAVGCRDYVTLLAGERFGAGVVIDGRLLRGTHGGVGEAVGFDHVEGVSSADGLDHRVVAWARDAIAAGDLPSGHPLRGSDPASVRVSTVTRLAQSGDPWANALVDRVAPVLARVAGLLGSFFDPAKIVVSGVVPAAVPRVIATAATLEVGELDLPAPQLVASELGAEVVAVGAVSAALEAARAEVLRIRR